LIWSIQIWLKKLEKGLIPEYDTQDSQQWPYLDYMTITASSYVFHKVKEKERDSV